VDSKQKILAEKRHHVILESIANRAGVCSFVDFKTVRNSILIEDVMVVE
jgi:hypothetical protein